LLTTAFTKWIRASLSIPSSSPARAKRAGRHRRCRLAASRRSPRTPYRFYLRRRAFAGAKRPAQWPTGHHPLEAAGVDAGDLPAIRVEGGPLYIQDGAIWTSGGVSSGFDLTLALVEEDYGFSLARDIAQDMVMYLRRPGGQLQFSRYNLQQINGPGPLGELLKWILDNLTGDLCVEKLAEKVAMSPRNFSRVFTRETGISPARYVAEARLAAARERLEQSNDTLERVASKRDWVAPSTCDASLKAAALTPGEYRQRFHCRKMA
jgi:AraC-like DNA-binding protein